ncbi:MobA/MobL family protein [Wohlfahrtiimonas chitiniclastica]|uniref:MobQ family relaxase n=1 Tax=Wohlfahrtiimonas chitiniclastica TaxID=400946 RepID=UPI001BCBB67A|nr:MobQ family relaxase [Wohlfahrtiimonas chitiniclastica]MBS7835272.1 MobA/MobL family protein [Wohlfahrtiimonas chitiniclastica]
MAIYHCTTKPISRANGRSATASSAYRASEKIKDLRTGEVHDYTKKQGVIYTEIINNLDESISRSQVWNTAELTETRKNSRVAREFIVALPDELNPEQRKELAKEFTQYLVNKYSVVADLAIHAPSKDGDDRNHHAHIMITTRKAVLVDGELKLTDKADLELSNAQRKDRGLCVTQDEIKEIRKTWAEMTNHALERSGSQARIDHRSYEDQNIDRQPTIHEGAKVTQLRRKGIQTQISKHNDQIKADNQQQQLEVSPDDIQDILTKASISAHSRLQAWKEQQEAKKQAQLEQEQRKEHKYEQDNNDMGFSR